MASSSVSRLHYEVLVMPLDRDPMLIILDQNEMASKAWTNKQTAADCLDSDQTNRTDSLDYSQARPASCNPALPKACVVVSSVPHVLGPHNDGARLYLHSVSNGLGLTYDMSSSWQYSPASTALSERAESILRADHRG